MKSSSGLREIAVDTARTSGELMKEIQCNQKCLDGFYKFVYDRHMVYFRRFVMKQPTPWSTDPVLRDLRFTNVYRELDAGTIWLVKNIVERRRGQFKEILWEICIYRVLNKKETFEAVGIPTISWWKTPSFRKNYK